MMIEVSSGGLREDKSIHRSTIRWVESVSAHW